MPQTHLLILENNPRKQKAVRNPLGAQTLAAAVRAAVGFGVGALIAKFLGVNTAFGGIVGALAPAVFKTMTSGNPWVAPSYKFY